MANIVSFGQGTYQNYAAISVKDPYRLYFCTDTQQIFLGNQEYTANVRQFVTMPLSYGLGKVVEYVGDTTQDYIQGYFYQMRQDGWEQIDVQPNAVPTVITYAQYNQLDPEVIEANRYVISDYPDENIDSVDVIYDNTTVYNKIGSIEDDLAWRTF